MVLSSKQITGVAQEMASEQVLVQYCVKLELQRHGSRGAGTLMDGRKSTDVNAEVRLSTRSL